VGDLPDLKQFTAQFAAVISNGFKGIEAILAAVGIGPIGKLPAEQADGRVNGIKKTT